MESARAPSRGPAVVTHPRGRQGAGRHVPIALGLLLIDDLDPVVTNSTLTAAEDHVVGSAYRSREVMYSELVEGIEKIRATNERLRAEAAALRAQASAMFTEAAKGDGGQESADAADD